ncbi:Peptidyl-prolyl cis-trans isomerase fpr2 [Botryosphaeria dothidea]|uniref:peptidylprolyl isomerase n=1 Tax=Botryosphaeria dothidea TaxID=55169 RepID=A0A8H4N571_9PEZI|nr:fkbp-type peptidyl-prolyl [Botryosphaeria dothidea]
MRFLTALIALLPLAFALEKPLDIEVVEKVDDCPRKTVSGDKVDVHYRGTLEADGSEFDASYKRNQPLTFTVGNGMVIKGWDQGLLDMCVGEKRKLTIQPEWAYGSRNVGPIPANSVLIFETELVNIHPGKDEL